MKMCNFDYKVKYVWKFYFNYNIEDLRPQLKPEALGSPPKALEALGPYSVM